MKSILNLSRKGLLIAVAVFICSLPAAAYGPQADVEKGSWGLSLNYPGAGIKYFAGDFIAFELRGQGEKGAAAGGLRFYTYAQPADQMLLYFGLEGDYIQYKGEVSRGYGLAGSAFCGFEYFVTSSISLQADFGPAYIYLRDKSDPVSLNAIEYVTNLGITVYWGGHSGRYGRKWSGY